MLLIEAYEVDPSKMSELMKMYDLSKEILKDLNLPFVKDWKVYQSQGDPSKIQSLVVFSEGGNYDLLMEAYLKHPKAGLVIERFQSLAVEGSITTSNHTELISL